MKSRVELYKKLRDEIAKMDEYSFVSNAELYDSKNADDIDDLGKRVERLNESDKALEMRDAQRSEREKFKANHKKKSFHFGSINLKFIVWMIIILIALALFVVVSLVLLGVI